MNIQGKFIIHYQFSPLTQVRSHRRTISLHRCVWESLASTGGIGGGPQLGYVIISKEGQQETALALYRDEYPVEGMEIATAPIWAELVETGKLPSPDPGQQQLVRILGKEMERDWGLQ